MIIQLRRFTYDRKKQKSYKLNKQISAPNFVTLAAPVTTYKLNSIVNHIGDTLEDGGHYTLILKDENKNEFVLIDDSNIQHKYVKYERSNRFYMIIYDKI